MAAARIPHGRVVADQRWASPATMTLALLLALVGLGCGAEPDEPVDPGPARRDGGRPGLDGGRGTSDGGGSAPDGGRGVADGGGAAPDGGRGAVDGGGSARDGGGSADAGRGTPDGAGRTCEDFPPVSDYGAKGPFDVLVVTDTGPGGGYTLYRPGTSLGQNGLKHPIATWGNGIATTPDQYRVLLTHLASHGFVVIACNDVQAERPCLDAGLQWLVEQSRTGPMAGKLDVTREVTIGYSWGGGAAIDTANRPNVKATVSLHGMPPRETDAFAQMHSPLLLFTSTGDSFVTKEEYVTPNYDSSQVQTFYATLVDASVGHLYVVDVGAFSCLSSLFLGDCGDARLEQAPTVAWLRMLACDDRAARAYFYGPACELCRSPWSAQKKHWPQPDQPF